MSNRNLTIVASILVALVLAGCASAPEREISREVAPYAALQNGNDPLNPDRLSPHLDAATSGIERGVIRFYESKRGHALNVLTISGGGQNGAFGAGFLIGWRESGRRPEFDIVTGVSTGALLATHAFLGTPADDAVLEEIYMQTTKDDIYRNRGIVSVALGANSLKDSAPLAALIAKHITPEVLNRMAPAYDDNRRLWVGTTNIDYDQTWLWNMTLIAKEGGPGALERYRKVLLASASFPIVFPPVEIDGHLFVDGAARANIVVTGVAGKDNPKVPAYGPGNIYVLTNGRLEHPPHTVPNTLTSLASTTIAVMMNASMESVMLRAFLAAKYHGYTFNMTEIPADAKIGKDPLAFDPTQMRAGFDAGRALAKQRNPWTHTPPNLGNIPAWMMDVIP
jgi:predicted acylesterase/phospholipase RssA/outer membrane murein-binding lipoprotein Lpp